MKLKLLHFRPTTPWEERTRELIHEKGSLDPVSIEELERQVLEYDQARPHRVAPTWLRRPN